MEKKFMKSSLINAHVSFVCDDWGDGWSVSRVLSSGQEGVVAEAHVAEAYSRGIVTLAHIDQDLVSQAHKSPPPPPFLDVSTGQVGGD